MFMLTRFDCIKKKKNRNEKKIPKEKYCENVNYNMLKNVHNKRRTKHKNIKLLS